MIPPCLFRAKQRFNIPATYRHGANILKRNAILSVSNKERLEEFAKFLISNGYELYGTTGTKTFLDGKGLKCSSVETLTGSPEMLGGRVKTLSSSLFAGILAIDRDDPDLRRFDYLPIDLVYVEPYDFMGNLNKRDGDLVEYIDIGGISLLRAAAKNYRRVIPVLGRVGMETLEKEMKNGEISLESRKRLAAAIFRSTSLYDYAISSWLGPNGQEFTVGGKEVVKLRYGENPHQSGKAFSLYPPFFEILREGKEISFNNILDAWTAWDLVLRLGKNSSAVVKHSSPCGAAAGKGAMEMAYESDPISAYGGVLAYNGTMGGEQANFLKKKFLEVVIADGYGEDALELLSSKKNLRILKGRKDAYKVPDIRSAGNMLLVQEWNVRSKLEVEVKSGIVSEETIKDVNFGWEVVKSIKSNAVSIVRNGWLVSSGGGQPNRVDSVRLALQRMKASGRLQENLVLISDGFFPFADSLKEIVEGGIKIVAAPMGSIRDSEIVDYSKANALTFIEVKERAFRH